MSVAEAVTPAAVASEVRAVLPRPRMFSPRFLLSELMLIFGRRRNWAGLAVLAAIPVIIAVAVKFDPPSGGGGGPDFFAGITENGLFVALAALTVELPLFLPLAVAAISGDAIAGEANTGTLRYLLTTPVHRTRLLAVKYAAACIFAFASTLLVAGVGVLMGLILFGGGDMTLLSGRQIGFGEGVLRVLGVCAYLGICLCSMAAVGLFASSLTEQPIGAMIGTMIFTVASFILDNIPQIDWLHPYLLTHSWMNFGDLLRDPVNFTGLREGLLRAAAYAVVFATAAWARFGGKDVTS
ncbi:ABC transporter permease [Hamadaea tsunoensis]|uniref:ABC transporter permease n=1 Tax=Hamadaea tsunoensis TaxID=53368 RepID=UPI0009FEF581|nr:ABC transporter permease [Hamadaea tsunoensis]